MPPADPNEHPIIAKYSARLAPDNEAGPLPLAEARELYGALVKINRRFAKTARISDSYQTQVKTLVRELQEALRRNKTLHGMLAICSSCKQIRDEQGQWHSLETYITQHTGTIFSHGMCPTCAHRFYADVLTASDLPALPATRTIPAARLSAEDLGDQVIARFLPLVNDPQNQDMPLHADLKALFHKYVRLHKRMQRIAEISDRYHAEFHKAHLATEWAALSDPLTGLLNRRGVLQRLELARAQSIAAPRGLGVVMLDLVSLSDFNRRHGFETGDRALVAVARLLGATAGPAGICGRWDGDEFLLVVRVLHPDEVQAAVEQLCTKVAAVKFPTAEGAGVRASAGWALLEAAESMESWLGRATVARQRHRATLPG